MSNLLVKCSLVVECCFCPAILDLISRVRLASSSKVYGNYSQLAISASELTNIEVNSEDMFTYKGREKNVFQGRGLPEVSA